MRNEGGGFAAIDDEVAAVLAFIISSATFLAAQDDETGRCRKVAFSHQSPVIPNPRPLIPAYRSLRFSWKYIFLVSSSRA